MRRLPQQCNNAYVRREREALLDEQRRLLLALEQHSSPENLERAARGLGLQPARAAQIEARTHSAAPRSETHSIVGASTVGAVLRR